MTPQNVDLGGEVKINNSDCAILAAAYDAPAIGHESYVTEPVSKSSWYADLLKAIQIPEADLVRATAHETTAIRRQGHAVGWACVPS
jgi:hypothetical protein